MYTMWRHAGSMRSHGKSQHQSDNGNFRRFFAIRPVRNLQGTKRPDRCGEDKAAIRSGFAEFVKTNGRKPHYADCRIVWKYTNGSEDVKIRLSDSGEGIGSDMFFSCGNIHALESLANFGKEPFIVTECYGFKTLTEEEISDEKAYEYEFGDEKIVVTGKEVRAFYSEVYRLTAQDIEQFAAYNTAKRMYYRKN